MVNPPGQELLQLVTSGNTLRITDTGGLYFQGVFENDRQVVFPRIEPDPTVVFFSRSDINFEQNLIASVTFNSINQWTALMMRM